jgi:hypothetical protein
MKAASSYKFYIFASKTQRWSREVEFFISYENSKTDNRLTSLALEKAQYTLSLKDFRSLPETKYLFFLRPAKWLNEGYFLFVFRICLVYISTGAPNFLTEAFWGFRRSLYTNFKVDHKTLIFYFLGRYVQR